MTIHKVTQDFEIKFWDILIWFMKEEGPLSKFMRWFTDVIHSKAGFFTVLIILWAIMGFIMGIVLGRVIWILQLV